MGAQTQFHGPVERLLFGSAGLQGLADHQFHPAGAHPVLFGQGQDLRTVQTTFRLLPFQDIFPELHPLAAVEGLEPEAVGEAAQDRILDGTYIVCDPDHPQTGHLQELVEPTLVLGLPPPEPGIFGVQKIVGLVHYNNRSGFLLGQVQAGHDGRPAVRGLILLVPDDLVTGLLQGPDQPLGVAGFSGSGVPVKQNMGGGWGRFASAGTGDVPSAPGRSGVDPEGGSGLTAG